MRVLHLISSLDPAAGGPREVIVQFARGLAQLGHVSTVATADDPAAPWLHIEGASVQACGPGSAGYRASAGLVRWLREAGGAFDVAIVHGLWQHHGRAALLALHGRVPWVVFPHGMLDPWFRRRYPLKHLKKLLYWLLSERWLLSGASRVLFTCEEEARLAPGTFPFARWEGAVVPLGIADPAVWRPDVAAFHAAHPALAGRRYLLFLGRLHEKKGCDLLLEAWLAHGATAPDLHLVYAGPDESGLRDALAARARDAGAAGRLHFVGMVRDAVKWGAVAGAEAFVLASHQENFGIAVVEALACEVPVLVSRQVNIWREILADGAGLAATDDVAGTTAMLGQWLALPAEARQEMRARARRCFLGRFEVGRASERLVAVLDEAIALGRRQERAA